MAAFLVRVLLAAIAVVLIFAILPPFFTLIGFAPPGPLMQIIRICIGGLAILYVFWGPAPLWPPRA